MDASRATAESLTVFLVHGGFADSSSWNPVIKLLQDAGVPVRAIANPLRGLSEDSAYIASAISQTSGPVLAVGHSYGGAVITNAAAKADNVVGLVYVGGFEAATEFVNNPTNFHDAFTKDEPEKQAAIMVAATQHPFAALAFLPPSDTPAWRTLPSWAVVPTREKGAGGDVLRFVSEQPGANRFELEGSHVIVESQPQFVANLILHAIDFMWRRVASAASTVGEAAWFRAPEQVAAE